MELKDFVELQWRDKDKRVEIEEKLVRLWITISWAAVGVSLSLVGYLHTNVEPYVFGYLFLFLAVFIGSSTYLICSKLRAENEVYVAICTSIKVCLTQNFIMEDITDHDHPPLPSADHSNVAPKIGCAIKSMGSTCGYKHTRNIVILNAAFVALFFVIMTCICFAC